MAVPAVAQRLEGDGGQKRLGLNGQPSSKEGGRQHRSKRGGNERQKDAETACRDACSDLLRDRLAVPLLFGVFDFERSTGTTGMNIHGYNCEKRGVLHDAGPPRLPFKGSYYSRGAETSEVKGS